MTLQQVSDRVTGTEQIVNVTTIEGVASGAQLRGVVRVPNRHGAACR